ncbi:MlaD family protein [Marinilabiliaceae bacterium ANBcel2]|nr:MlaD family protein [Marinilabiliaceae bacterium ANBcel2]
MHISKEAKIGVLLIVALSILVWGFNFLKGKSVFLTGDVYYGVYERVDRIYEGTRVLYKGYPVGSVQNISIHPSQPGRFIVTFNMRERIALAENSIAAIYTPGVMNSKVIEIIPGDSPVLLSRGDTLETKIIDDFMGQIEREFMPVKDKTEDLLDGLNTFMHNLNALFAEDNEDNIYNTVSGLNSVIANFEETGDDISTSFENIDKITSAIERQTPQLEETINNLAELTAELTQSNISGLTVSADTLMNNISSLLNDIERGYGSAGLLLNDPQLYLNLNSAVVNLDRVLMDLRENPKRYVNFSAFNFGRNVYIEPSKDKAEEMGIQFMVKLEESRNPQDSLRGEMLDKQNDHIIAERRSGRFYIYTVGETSLYSDAIKLKNLYSKDFPKAEVVAFKNGAPIKLDYALEKTDALN